MQFVFSKIWNLYQINFQFEYIIYKKKETKINTKIGKDLFIKLETIKCTSLHCK